MQDRILMIGEDRQIADAVAAAAAALNCKVVAVRKLEDGLAALTLARFRLVVLDCDTVAAADAVLRLGSVGAGAKLLVLGAQAQDVPGADGVLCRSCGQNELRDRLDALLTAVVGQAGNADLLVFGDLHIRLVARTVHVQSRHVDVSPKEFDLISYFARHAGQVVTRMQLLEHVWNMRFDPGTNVVDVHVGRLRRKLDKAGAKAIQTARGEGYIFSPNPRGHGAKGQGGVR